MSFRFTARLAFVLVAVLALSTIASAEPVDGGQLYIVAANAGLFDPFDAAATYTLIHHTTFEPGDFPDFLRPISFPSFGFPSFNDPTVMDIGPGGQAFALGFTSGPGPAHLLKTGDGPVDPALQAAMLGVVGGLVGNPAITEISSADFWGGIDPASQAAWLGDSVFAMSAMTSEDLFGLTDPVAAGSFGFGLTPVGSSVITTQDPSTMFYTQGNGFTSTPTTRAEPPPLPVPIPEPGTLALVAGALGAGYLKRRKKKAA